MGRHRLGPQGDKKKSLQSLYLTLSDEDLIKAIDMMKLGTCETRDTSGEVMGSQEGHRPQSKCCVPPQNSNLLPMTPKISAKTIQRILRHKNLATTEKYIHNINRDLGEVMNLLGERNPGEKLPTANEQ